MQKTILKHLLLILLLSACTGNKETETKPGPLYPQPKTVELNITEGYSLNAITRDTIKPIITKSGDTINTGRPIPVIKKTIHPDSVAQPKIIPLIAPESIKNAHPNIYKIPDELTIIVVNKDSLITAFIEEITKDDTAHYIINRTGDTIKTGVQIPVKGKIAPTSQPKPLKALPPKFKDAAINNMQYLDVDQGLSYSYVLSVLEDKSGKLWFGTDGGGVSMYNGESFTHFGQKEGLSNNQVWSIIEDKSGNLWFATYGGGVSMYNGESFTHFTKKEGLSENEIWSILEDKSGNLWFGTNGGGVSMYNGESLTHFTEKEGLSNNTVLSILEDKSGNLWFGTNGGVSMYNGQSFTHFTEKEGLSNNQVWSILEDKNGNLWFATNGGGVSMYNGESFTYFTEKEGLPSNEVWSILEDKNGNLWFGTNGGVSMYNGESFTHFTEKEGLSNNTVRSIIEDKSGNLWLGTYGGGVSIYNEESFTHFTKKEGLSNNIVRSIAEDKSGNLWFGTYGGGVSMYNGESFTHFTEKEGLSNNEVWSILEDKSGNLWFGTYSGVSMYNGENFTHFTKKEGLSNRGIWSIIEDQNGNLWFGTNGGGVSMYNGESFTHFTEKEGLSNNTVRSIIEDKSGNLWFGTNGGGVSIYNGESFTHFTEKEGLSNNEVWSILEDQNGNLWFGTDGGGLSMYNGESFTHFTEKEGLSNNTIWSILEDKSGNLWLSTDNGLTKFTYDVSDVSNPKYDPKNKKVIIGTFKKNDGLNGMDFFPNSVCLDSKNRIWWGSGKSLTMLDLNKFNCAKKPPTVYLNNLTINEQFIDYRNISDSLGNEIKFKDVQPFENYPLNLALPYDQNHLTFHFAAIDWSAPHKIRYSYLMDGLNTNWSQPSHEAKADYRNVLYGNYIFKVRAIGESGEWSDAFEYEFTIHPPWWHTWWARAGYGIATLLLIWGFVRWRTAKLKQRQKELEKEVDDATEEIRNQKDKIEKEKEKSDELLLNILPAEVAEELKEKGHSDAQLIDHVTVLFTDFKGFTALSEELSPKELVADLHACFSEFDRICEKYGIEKIKTIGDAYMAAGGLPSPNTTHAQDVVKATLEMAEVIEKSKAEKTAANQPFFEVRIGVHTGPVVAGIVGVKKFQYDIWGDTVNTASRMESSGVPGKVNISEVTYELLKDDSNFTFKSRGKITAKGKGEMEMYFVERSLKKE